MIRSCSRRCCSTLGLCGVNAIRKPADFNVASKAAIAGCDALRYAVKNDMQSATASDKLLAMDAISNKLCSILDISELCRNVHSDQQYRESAHDAYMEVSTYMNGLNVDLKLYKQLASIVENESIWTSLSVEEKLFAQDLKLEFETDGVHLSPQDLPEVQKYQLEVMQLESSYMQNVNTVSESFRIGPILESENFRGIQQWCANYQPQPDTLPVGYIQCPSQKQLILALLCSIPQEHIRKQIWEGGVVSPSGNVEILGNIIRAKSDLMRTMGYDSYTDRFLKNKALTSGAEVLDMCEDLLSSVQEKSAAEHCQLLSLKQQVSVAKDEDSSQQVYAWDMQFLQHQAKSHAQSQHRSTSKHMSDYLKLSDCIQGIAHVTSELFGVTMKPATLTGQESWTANPADVMKYSLYEGSDSQQASHIGDVYLDIIQRPNKFSQSAHFTIQCGCVDGAEYVLSKYGGSHDTQQKVNQVPIVVLVLNFPPSEFGSQKDICLTLSQLETLYHEWGHALHSLLSRTTFQHLSGTRGPLDFVEVPSHLIEYYARSVDVVSTWSQHYSTRAPIPRDLLEDALSQEEKFPALALQQQVLLSMADQTLFGSPLYSFEEGTSLSGEEVFFKYMTEIAELQTKFTHIGAGSFVTSNCKQQRMPNIFPLSHGHFIGYSAQIWNTQVKSNPLSRQTGQYLRDKLFSVGGAKVYKDILLDASGGLPLSAKYFLNEL